MTHLSSKVKQLNLSFRSAADLRNRIELLPKVPAWKTVEVKVPGGTTKKPLKFQFRDGKECFEFLFGHPRYNGRIDFCPKKVWLKEQPKRKSRLYSEILTGDLPWEIQVRLRCLVRFSLLIRGKG